MKHISINHHTQPKRRVVRKKRLDGKPGLVLECGHHMPGKLVDEENGKFFPCATCYGILKRTRREYRLRIRAKA